MTPSTSGLGCRSISCGCRRSKIVRSPSWDERSARLELGMEFRAPDRYIIPGRIVELGTSPMSRRLDAPGIPINGGEERRASASSWEIGVSIGREQSSNVNFSFDILHNVVG
jgi:hypothetical protein